MSNLREGLYNYKGQRAKFVGEFVKVSISKVRGDIVILVNNVKDSSDRIVAQHMWSTIDLSSVDARFKNIKPRQVVKFEGRVHGYTRHDGTKTVGIDDVIIAL